MRAIKLTCPECHAALDAAPGAQTVSCEYCGTRSHIRQRTRFLQRPAPLPKAQAAQAQLPVAIEQRSVGKAIVSAVVALLLVGVAPMAVCGLVCGGSIHLFGRLAGGDWEGIGGAMLRDINGDGVVEIIGRTRKLKPEAVMMLAAFDGASGDRLWETDTLGPREELLGAPLALADTLIVAGTGGGGLAGIDLEEGDIRWRGRLPEVVKRICAGKRPGTVAVLTADGALVPVTLASGKLGPPAKEGWCAPLPSPDPDVEQPHRIIYGQGDYREFALASAEDGISADTALHHVPSGVSIALGHKRPGTSVPMVARFRWPLASDNRAQLDPRVLRRELAESADRDQRVAAYAEFFDSRRRGPDGSAQPEVLWKRSVPGVDPFQVAAEEVKPTHADLNGSVVVVAYETKESDIYRLTAFEVADGKRRWDIELPGDRNLTGVVVTARHAVVSRWGTLQVFDLTSGEEAFVVD